MRLIGGGGSLTAPADISQTHCDAGGRLTLRRRADRLARYDDLDTPVLLTSDRRAIGRDRLAFAETRCANDIAIDSVLHHAGAHRFGPALGQTLVVGV